jgi:hypothetical protein
LKSTAGADFLEGSWENPLDEDIEDAILVYRDWMYRLPSRIRGRSSIKLLSSDIPKDINRFLQRRQSIKDSEAGQSWDASVEAPLERILDVVMMYSAAGGKGYTGLSHSYASELDTTPLARLNQAVIIGKLSKPVLDWQISVREENRVVREQASTTIIRFLVPIDVNR